MVQRAGLIPERDMFNTFNMGVGMSLVVRGEQADLAMRTLRAAGQDSYLIGEIAEGEEKVVLC